MCHVFYLQASPDVEAFCRKHGYPYRAYGWGTTLIKACANIRSPKSVADEAALVGTPQIGTGSIAG